VEADLNDGRLPSKVSKRIGTKKVGGKRTHRTRLVLIRIPYSVNINLSRLDLPSLDLPSALPTDSRPAEEVVRLILLVRTRVLIV
jgi:hypothetical protein